MTKNHTISRAALERSLQWTALWRSLVTLGVGMPIGLVMASAVPEPNAGVLVLFAIPLLLGYLITVTFCRRRVKCPICEGSLWSCGTGNFKPRRMRVRRDVTCCPHCQVGIG